VVLAVVLPALGRTAKSSMLATSFGNLMDLGAAHALYANDWNGRQVQVVVEDISTYGDSSAEAFNSYNAQFGPGGGHPPVGLGWGTLQSLGIQVFFAYRVGYNDANNAFATPMRFGPPDTGSYLGSFRLPNARPFHDYVGGRFYDPTFYAPADGPVWDTVTDAGCLALPDEFAYCVPPTDLGTVPAWSSYCLSPAALYHPNVMRSPADGGWQFPWSIDEAFETPGLFQARHPSLKTFMLEHNWIQNAPKDVCNPNFAESVYDDCEPYYFNHSIDSAPATLFYDLSVRLLPNTEALAADQQVQKQTGAGLWSRDTAFGNDGYLIELGFDGSDLSHHVLTTEGILGRDTIAGAGKR